MHDVMKPRAATYLNVTYVAANEKWTSLFSSVIISKYEKTSP